MSVIKSHDCKMCGGALEIDLDRQVYRCNYCGITYDYEYFREDNVAEVAQTALERSEFGAAKDAYEFILKKDPHDFAALRGLLLCTCKWKSIHPILHMSRVYLKEDTPELTYAMDNCLPDQKKYFDEIHDILSLKDEYKETIDQTKDIETKTAAERQIRNSIQDAIDSNENAPLIDAKLIWGGEYDLKSNMFWAAVTVVFLIIIAATAYLGFIVPIIVVASIIAVVVGFILRKRMIRRKLTNEIMPHVNEIARLTQELDDINQKAEGIKAKYIKNAKAIIAMDVELTKA